MRCGVGTEDRFGWLGVDAARDGGAGVRPDVFLFAVPDVLV
jgi:hypothetical protein